jgi:hypothetical protein
MKKYIFYIVIAIISKNCFAQPYIDLAKAYYGYSPASGLSQKNTPIRSGYYNISLTAPLKLQQDGDAIILNPFFDHNEGKVSGKNFDLISEGASIGFLNKIKNSDWDVFTALILRRNKEADKKINDDWQYGGAILTTYEKNKSLTLKFGLYYNKEFFGNFLMPLAGIDWKINEKDNLFGVLPGNMTFEHKVNHCFYDGAVFRAITSSYRLLTADPCSLGDCNGKDYLRIKDNQTGAFIDLYLSNRIVATLEIGYTAFRDYRYGFKGDVLHLKTDHNNDNYYFRLSLNYRIRFRE